MSGNRVLDASGDSARSMLPARRWALRLLAVVALLAGWQAVATRSTILLAPPTEVFEVLLAKVFVDRTLLRAIVDALRQAALGYALAVAVGVPVGFWTPGRDVLDPIVDALYSTPMVALAPLIIIWFGLTVVAKVFLVFVFAVFVIIINTEAGVTETPEGLIEAARTFGANDRQVYSKVHFRHALPYVLTGLRLGAGRAIRGMVAAELFLYADQLGEYLIDSGATFRIARLLAGIVALSAVGVLAVGAVGRLERHLVR